MNKIWLFGASICMVLALGSCKPKLFCFFILVFLNKNFVFIWLITNNKKKKNRQLRSRWSKKRK